MTTPEEQAAIELAKIGTKEALFISLTSDHALFLANALLSLNEKLEAEKIQSGAGTWRVGQKVPINVYEGDRPVCQCHNEMDAARIVAAMNSRALAQTSEPQQPCCFCNGRGTDYIGMEMRCVEVECSRCKGTGREPQPDRKTP